MCLLIVILFTFLTGYSQQIDADWVKANYTKREVMIPMRDGIKLFTAVYEPVNKSEKHPVLITRTPYKAAPYGTTFSSALWESYGDYSKEGYIFVFQDVRGKWMSEGTYMDVRPFNPNKKKKTDIDEASDTYDTVEWLLKHTKNNNGNVGVSGCSYPGFYALMGGLSNHPAIRAICPQAPVIDWFMGDDFHHNGAFLLADAFSFHSSQGRPRPVPVSTRQEGAPFYQTDEYSFFLKTGAIINFSALLGDSIAFWNKMMAHPDYDAWWKARNVLANCYHVQPAVLVVGGFFDAEDCYGALGLYKAINKQSPDTKLRFIMGPWSHGAWNSNDVSSLGDISFGMNTAAYYSKEVEVPFFNYYLKGKGNPDDWKKVIMFFSGENKWKNFTEWPPKKVEMTPLYLGEKGKLEFTAPEAIASFSQYVSDPSHPVPYTDKILRYRSADFMTGDQRFASRRTDVLTYQTEPLSADMTLGGELLADLKVSISTTDADFVVKLIDVFPDDADNTGGILNGYQMLVRGDVMRGRYRKSFEMPEAFIPNQQTTVSFRLNDIAHTFKKGQRVMVQIQSSWFPYVDRNPQQFVNIYQCSDSYFVKSAIKIFHQKNQASKIILPVLTK